APMHQAYPAPFLTTAHSAYETPLGIVPVERSVLAALEAQVAGMSGLHLEAVANDAEHALEIELPFLQRALAADFSLLPIMVRETNPQALRLLAEKLVEVLAGRDALLVASTDLSHFYPESQANRLDQELLRRVEQFDPEAVLHAELEGVGYACGRGAAALVMWAAKALGATQAQVVRYATSGATTGDFKQVVGYGAAVFTRPETQTKSDGE
ncbi:MAG TPA: AmmeMemoRadiSam system protein B, partial [Anaerolineales bacterium]|nr:AmmeMemoRadiSam system protein B [Anaerolineales bacterium]